MSASPAASSSLSRARTPVIVLTVIAAVCGIYYLRSSAPENADAPPPTAGLHRSNAIHRRQRRNTHEETTSLLLDGSGEPDQDAEIVARTLPDGETVADDQSVRDDYNWDALPQHPRVGQNIVQLLFRVSEDATKRNSYVHRGCECNACGVVPIRGVRYRCANCADYDLCESCESQGIHSKTHIFYKIRVPAPSSGPRHIQPVWYTGDPDSILAKPLPARAIAKLNRETGFERPELDAYWEQWTYMANTEWRDGPEDLRLAMDRKTFERCLVPSGSYRHSAPSLIFDRMFAFYDTNKDDLISFSEFLHGLTYRKRKDKWAKIFEVYDIDGDGFVERKDFLRMFRSYYVLYRQMHRDLLESMNEQQMSSPDAHRVIHSRQPLSSAFGQNGPYPAAPDPRAGEGKLLFPNGDLEISDGKDVINESSDDTGNREDVFRASIPRGTTWSRQRQGRYYWDAILNPPISVEQMPEVLRNLTLAQDSTTEISREHPGAHPTRGLNARRSHNNNNPLSDSDDSLEADEDWLPGFVTVTQEDAEAIDGPGATISTVARSSRQAVIAHAVQREQVNRNLYERWRKRQFYTDEEEGGVPPADWKEEDDVLAPSEAGESSKNPPRPHAHSRSSSKVRFAEELDDFDTRSNPSTSSRSVPERWGGMEIPDAERDAGKEILYQVTQQGFNELLDPFFKEKEDLALQAATTKAQRDKYRHLYTTPAFENWAQQEEYAVLNNKSGERTESNLGPSGRYDIPDVEVEQVRARSLEELLAATGFEVSDDFRLDHDGVVTSPPQVSIEQNMSDTLNTLISTPQGSSSQRRTPPPELLSLIRDPGLDHSSSQSTEDLNRQGASSPEISDEAGFRDPTLPQFRPNTAPDLLNQPSPPTNPRDWSTSSQATSTTNSLDRGPVPNTSRPAAPDPRHHSAHSGNPQAAAVRATLKPRSQPSSTDAASPSSEPSPAITNRDLLQMWKLDREERQMQERGGWARLNKDEFVDRIAKSVEEGQGNKMDYLGSWVDFCLP